MSDQERVNITCGHASRVLRCPHGPEHVVNDKALRKCERDKFVISNFAAHQQRQQAEVALCDVCFEGISGSTVTVRTSRSSEYCGAGGFCA